MDRAEKKRFDWLPIEMPGVSKLVREKRALHGEAHVNECWRRGVLMREPGWFFAREGALAVGTPFETDPVLIDMQWRTYTKTQATLLMKTPEVAHGAN